MDKKRCSWVTNDPTYQNYHDNVWGRPVIDSVPLFAKLCLDGQQAGLSWLTILKKMPGYYEAFNQFDPDSIATFDDNKVASLMENRGIVRNKQKIRSIIKNAKAFQTIETREGAFSDALWDFVEGKTKINHWVSDKDIPVSTAESDAMAKWLKQKGFSFVGTTICYAFMQAVGMVNDHTTDCFCYEEVCNLARK